MSSKLNTAPRVAIFSLGILAAILLGTLAVAAGLMVVFAGSSAPQRPILPDRPPAPRLEEAGGADLARVRAAGDRRLKSWGWTDRSAELAHIPIDRALQIAAQRGWSDVEPAP